MSHISQSSRVLAALTLTSALVSYAASASPIQRAQYEVYNDQQSAPRDDQETVANQQTPSELQSHGAQHQSSQDQPQANEQPAAGEPKSEQAATPPPAPEQPSAFVSEKSNEPQDVVQAPQGEQSEQKSPEQKSDEQVAGQTEQAPPSTETKSGEDDDPYNP